MSEPSGADRKTSYVPDQVQAPPRRAMRARPAAEVGSSAEIRDIPERVSIEDRRSAGTVPKLSCIHRISWCTLLLTGVFQASGQSRAAYQFGLSERNINANGADL